MKRIFFLALSVVISITGFAQSNTSYRAESFGSLASGEYTPFWITNQNWGVNSLDANNFYVRGGIFHEQRINKDWSFQVGADIVSGNSSPYGNIWVQQLYGRIDWKIWRLDIGSREDYMSALNPYLSSGDFIQSNNARPIPEIKISIPEYLLVPHTNESFFIKGNFAVGKFLDNEWMKERAEPALQNYVQDHLSHHKSIYFRFGDITNRHKMQFTVGMQHYAQWGAAIYNYQKNYEDGSWFYKKIKDPVGLDDFYRIVIAKEGSPSGSESSSAYIAGSQWGAYLFKYDYLLKDQSIISAYIHHFFEDGSGMVFENYRDNLLGIEYNSGKKSLLSGAVFEYIYSKQQTGPIHHNMMMDEEHKHLKNKGNGNDNYYNNVDYVQGPSHFGRTLGTPLFLSPAYNTDGSLEFKSSRIIAFHLGVNGYFNPSLQYRLMLTTGRSWGRYYLPYTSVKEGFASLVELRYSFPKIKEFELKANLAYDKGEFFSGNSFGGSISLIKRGILRSKQ
ncbi:capsule assembly Wzi family protein [Bacteroidales bacterium OttesenSCG-928-A17]|nr:capsule assembly Wzi family protein [Bacteroidales bacterium OttesenSCG-928-A17]